MWVSVVFGRKLKAFIKMWTFYPKWKIFVIFIFQIVESLLYTHFFFVFWVFSSFLSVLGVWGEEIYIFHFSHRDFSECIRHRVKTRKILSRVEVERKNPSATYTQFFIYDGENERSVCRVREPTFFLFSIFLWCEFFRGENLNFCTTTTTI